MRGATTVDVDSEPEKCVIRTDEEMHLSKYNEEDSTLFPIQESPENKLKYFEVTPNRAKPDRRHLSVYPQPMFADDPKVLRILVQKGPMEMHGPVLLDRQRKVLWRNLCMLGRHHIECVVEMSIVKSKFFIVALDLYADKFHVVELWLPQAQKIVKACDDDLEKVMKMLDFKLGRLYLKH